MTASVFVGTSLDGFLARQDGTYDFLTAGGGGGGGGEQGDGDAHGFAAFLATVDAIVMGRNTYDVVFGMEPWPYGQKPIFILTSRPLPATRPELPIERIEGTPGEVVQVLSERGFQHLYVDGGMTIQAFLREGLIQRMTITRVPVLIGSGIPLFGSLPQDVRLHHVETKHLGSGFIQSTYDVLAE